ncbi:MAG: ribonuclease P protein component [Treponema sp.]|nr:ribonuclease P protein component [Treponema sp.]
MPTRKSPISSPEITASERVGASKRGGGSERDKGSFRFRREEHLKGRNDIREVFGKGKRFGCRGAKLFMLKNKLPYNRICFTFPRGFGTAVERNRSRRLGREAYRSLKPRLKCGYDLILLVYPMDADPGFNGRMEQLSFLFTRAGLL